MAGRRREVGLFDDIAASSARASWRLGIWGLVAFVAVGVAMLAPHTEAPPLAARTFDAEIEARRLNDAVRVLAADRDRLLARIGALERNLDDVTGPIPKQSPPGKSAIPSAPTPVPGTPMTPSMSGPGSATAPLVVAPASPWPQTQPPAAGSRVTNGFAAAVEPGPAASVATKTEFGIDIGSAGSVDGLRSLWASFKERHEVLFEGLRPVVAIRDGGKPGSVELRLVAGPLANAGAAVRLCAALSSAGHVCQPAVFDG